MRSFLAHEKKGSAEIFQPSPVQYINLSRTSLFELPRNKFRGFWEHQTYNYLLKNML